MGRTVFVVGAGASVEFDVSGKMPVGSKLAEQIEELLDEELAPGDLSERPISSALMQTGGFRDEHQHAMRRIVNGIQSRDSIDQFIEDCKDVPELSRVAKLCISYLINEAERTTVLGEVQDSQSSLAFRRVRESWLGQICRRANPKINRQDFSSSLEGISFVTFNYDRCIEQFLYQYARFTLSIDDQTARRKAASVPVLHVYGSLGWLPGFGNEQNSSVRFGEDDPRYLPRMASGLRTYSEQIDTGISQQIRFLMHNAETVVFLGAAYHQQNLDALFPSQPSGDVRIYGTTFGMRALEVQRTEMFFRKLSRGSLFQQMHCDKFINEVRDELF